jgi:hypothetical protein
MAANLIFDCVVTAISGAYWLADAFYLNLKKPDNCWAWL